MAPGLPSPVGVSRAYFERNCTGHPADLQANENLVALTAAQDLDVGSVLEMGCGGGANLRHLSHTLGVPSEQVWGVEPSASVVERLRTAYPVMRFHAGEMGRRETARDLLERHGGPFDLVALCMVLHWIPRNRLLGALECVFSLVGRTLMVVDFAPPSPFKVPFHHHPGLWTWHQAPSPLILATGAFRLIRRLTFGAHDPMTAGEAVLLERTEFPARPFVLVGT